MNSQEIKTDVRVTFRWIDHGNIYTQHNISFQTSGKSSKDFQKLAYKFSFDTDYNQTFFSRPNIKLRSGVTDPTMLREKTYIDLLNSAGIPTQQGQYVRLFVNNQPIGLYMMVDDIKKSFIKQTVYGGDPSIIPGSLVQVYSFCFFFSRFHFLRGRSFLLPIFLIKFFFYVLYFAPKKKKKKKKR